MAKSKLDELPREELVARSRAIESKINVLRAQAARDPDGYRQALDEARSEHDEISKRLRDADAPEGAAEEPDPEGTAPTLADSEGNFAPNADVAAEGGIGVKGSNTAGGDQKTDDQKGKSGKK